MFFTYLLLGTIAYLFAVFYWQRRRQMQVFKNMGIPGPEPNFLFGNLLAFKTKPMYQTFQDWAKTYGETYGYFEGPTPVLVTSDADILHQVFIKRFNNFHKRKLWPVQVDPDNDEDVHLFFARGQRWKRLRSVVNPAFTATKMRKMEPQMNLCADRLVEVMDKAAEKSEEKRVLVTELFRRLTLNTIVRCALGIQDNTIRDPDSGFLRHCQGVIEDTTKQPVLYALGFTFPALSKLWMTLYKLMHHIKFNPVYWLEEKIKQCVQYRKQNSESSPDLLRQMLDARYEVKSFHELEKKARGEKEGEKIDLNGNVKKPVLRSLTENEVVQHALLFLMAGYETSSTSLGYIFFELATNPHVQHELRKEIEHVLEGEEATYDNIRKLKYMDMVISETLRKYPLASNVIARQCDETCEINGLTIPAGMLVAANTWTLHHDPKHWGPNPETFDPMRFTPENKAERHSMAWIPFGAGPRMCIGFRFAWVQMKLVMCKLLSRYSFEPASDLQNPLPLKEGATILFKEEVPLRVLPLP